MHMRGGSVCSPPGFSLARTEGISAVSPHDLVGCHRVSVHRQGRTFGLHLDGLRRDGMMDTPEAYPQPARLGSFG